MQRLSEIRDLFAYNRWANARTRSSLAQLNDEQFTRDLRSSYPSIRATVLHVMASEWIWLTRWLGNSPTAMPDEWTAYTLAQIEVEWHAIEAAQHAYLSNLAESDLDRVIAYRNLKGEAHANPLWQLLRHMVNHSSYHRGQITTMMRQVGGEPASTDLVLYFRQQQAALAQ